MKRKRKEVNLKTSVVLLYLIGFNVLQKETLLLPKLLVNVVFMFFCQTTSKLIVLVRSFYVHIHTWEQLLPPPTLLIQRQLWELKLYHFGRRFLLFNDYIGISPFLKLLFKTMAKVIKEKCFGVVRGKKCRYRQFSP